MTQATELSAEPLPALDLRPALEAVLRVADQPLDAATLAAAVGHPVPDVDQELVTLAASYDEEGRGFELRQGGRRGGGPRVLPSTRSSPRGPPRTTRRAAASSSARSAAVGATSPASSTPMRW